MENYYENNNICIQFLRNNRCIDIYCHKKHKEVCKDWQKNKCMLGDLCKKYHPKVNCLREIKKRGSCKHGLNCSFNHNFGKYKSIKLNSSSTYIKNNIINRNVEKNKINEHLENQMKIQKIVLDSVLEKLNERKMIISKYVNMFKHSKNDSEIIINQISEIDIEVINSEIRYYEKYLNYNLKRDELTYTNLGMDVYLKLYKTDKVEIINARKIFGIEHLTIISVKKLSTLRNILLSKFIIFDIDENYIKNFIDRITQLINNSYDIIFNIL